MNSTYFPIVKALAAEFSALKETKPNTTNQIVPVFELPKLPDKKKYTDGCLTPIVDFINDTASEIGTLWAGKLAMFDAYHWDPATTTEIGDHIITYAYDALKNTGVKIIPVVGYDRWEVQEYRMALQTISATHDGVFCIRLDHTAFEDAADADYFKENLEEILHDLGVNPARCHVIMDFADVTHQAVTDLLNGFDELFDLIKPYGFLSFSIAGCSLPKTINEAVKTQNTCGVILRKEMLLWESSREQYPDMPIHFGDYGVRGPNTNEGVINPHTNGKIRYTIEKGYFVARGQSLKLPPKGEQMWQLAEKVINSGHYLGPQFSWGDSEILRCSKKEFKGNAGTWIAIDTNHHFAYVVAEILEFEHTLATRTASKNKVNII